MLVPSGDHCGEKSLGPIVSRLGCSLPLVATVKSAVSYPTFLAFTLTRTNTTREPSGDLRIANPREREQVSFGNRASRLRCKRHTAHEDDDDGSAARSRETHRHSSSDAGSWQYSPLPSGLDLHVCRPAPRPDVLMIGRTWWKLSGT